MVSQLLTPCPRLTKRQQSDYRSAPRHRRQRRQREQHQAFLRAVTRARHQNRGFPAATTSFSDSSDETTAMNSPTIDDAPTAESKRPAPGQSITWGPKFTTETSTIPWPHETKSETTAFQAARKAAKLRKVPARDSAVVLDFDNEHPHAATEPPSVSYTNGDFPAYSTARRSRAALEPLFPLSPRHTITFSPEREEIASELLGLQTTTEPTPSGRAITYFTTTGPTQQMSIVPSLRHHDGDFPVRTNKLTRAQYDSIAAHIPETLRGYLLHHSGLIEGPESAEKYHLRNYGVPVFSSHAHWYEEMEVHGCPTAVSATNSNSEKEKKQLCVCTHEQYTKLTHAEYKREQQQQSLKRKREGEMVERDMEDVVKAGGKRERKKSRKMVAMEKGEA